MSSKHVEIRMFVNKPIVSCYIDNRKQFEFQCDWVEVETIVRLFMTIDGCMESTITHELDHLPF